MVSIKELREITGRKKKEDLYLALLRKPSIYLVKIFAELDVSPDQITFSWIFLHVISTVLFAFGKYEYIVGAVLVKFIGDLLDTTDGAIARFKGKGNFRGVYLEKVGHNVILPYMFLAIGFGVFLNTGNVFFLFAGVVAGLNLNIMELVLIGKEVVVLKRATESQMKDTIEVGSSFVHKIYGFLVEIYVALHSFILIFFGIINRLDIFIVFAAVYTIPMLLVRIMYDYARNLGLKDKHYELKK